MKDKEKKIYIKAYMNCNLGDDLFLKILLNRYEKGDYTFCSYDKLGNNIPNTTILNKNEKLKKILNKAIKVLTFNKNSYENILMNRSDLIVSIGGSMYIQSQKKTQPYFIGKNVPYYILGSNFGPYHTEEYYEKFYNIFSKAEDVCFREEHSYKLFEKLPNVRYASDIVFSLDTSNIQITNNKKVVISVIDCAKKAKSEYKENYEKAIVQMIDFFDKNGYEIILMSYCKKEGDEDAINSILSKIENEEIKSKIKTYFYSGDIDEALNVMGDCQVVVGSRFHANILGLVLNKTIIPIAYSDKTLNVLNDMNFQGKIYDIRNLDDFENNPLTEEDLKYKLDINFQIKDAQRHFEKLDQVLWRTK